MNKLPPRLRKQVAGRSVCLILEGFEETVYFERLIALSLFSRAYRIKPVNAKGANNIPAKYQEALASDSYSAVLVVCDRDRRPDVYNKVVHGIDEILGKDKAREVITFTCPCTLQVILSHFGDVSLKTQAKTAARNDVYRLTGVKDYDAHGYQLDAICQKIYWRNWDDMLARLKRLSTDPEEIPSSNMARLFERLCSDDVSWIDHMNHAIFADGAL